MPNETNEGSSNLSYNPVESPIVPHKAEANGSVAIDPNAAETLLTPLAIADVCKELEVGRLSKKAISGLAKLGIEVESQGSVQISNGSMIVTQTTLLHCMMLIGKGMTDAKSALKAAPVLCEVSAEIRKNADYWKTRVSTNAKPAPGPDRVESFDADNPVQPLNFNTQINIHGKAS